MAFEQGKVQIEKFDSTDFGSQKMQVEDFLYQKNLYQQLKCEKLKEMSTVDWALLDRKAQSFVHLTLAKM